MSLLRYLLLLVFLVGWCTAQDSADLLRLTLEAVAQRQDRLLQKFEEQETKIELQLQEQETKIELQLQEFLKTLEENVRLQVEKIQTEVDAFRNTFLTEQEVQRRSLQQFQVLIAADECEQGRSNCSASATCKDAVGHYKCICRPGYAGDGITCQDIDECKTENKVCGEGSTCINHPGTFGCLCHEGFREVNHFCTDVDECTERNNVCRNEQVCTNLPGNYSCNCNEGYTKEGDACQDLNECDSGVDGCHKNATCINTLGSYTCQCLPYYYGDGHTCIDCQSELSKTGEMLIDTINNNGNNLTSVREEMLREFLEQKESQCQRKGIASNCKELLDNGEIRSGVYTISPEGMPEGVEVYCDQVTSGGGWTVILQRKRQTHQVDFARSFEDYAAGFGDPNREIWIGNRVLHLMTTGYEPFTLRVDAVNLQGESRTGIWENFSVGSEATQFTLSVSDYSSSSSTLGDGLWKPNRRSGSANGMKFSTVDRDNDKGTGHCARGSRGGWWYNDCYGVRPMAPLGTTNSDSKANWYHWEPTSTGSSVSISEIQFKIRP